VRLTTPPSLQTPSPNWDVALSSGHRRIAAKLELAKGKVSRCAECGNHTSYNFKRRHLNHLFIHHIFFTCRLPIPQTVYQRSFEPQGTATTPPSTRVCTATTLTTSCRK
jgi:hypothetical protein